ncbi:hypothetical protein V6Z11_A12G142600 [Gossypium hirsutum]
MISKSMMIQTKRFSFLSHFPLISDFRFWKKGIVLKFELRCRIES